MKIAWMSLIIELRQGQGHCRSLGVPHLAQYKLSGPIT